MKLFSVLKKPLFLALALLSAALFAAVYVYTQVLGNVHNIEVWFSVIPPLHLGLFIIFAALFGAAFSFQAFLWLQPKLCSIEKRAGAAGGSGLGSMGLFFVAQCPACASLGALFLPVSAITVIAQYTALINAAGIALLLFTLNYLGAFQDENEKIRG